jgi:hypothetical protein
MNIKKPPVRFGAATVDESRLIREFAALQEAVARWAKGYDLWEDANFHVPFIHRGARVGRP